MRASGVLRVDIPVEVPFFDVDSMDVVWHGHYVKYLELARCALLHATHQNLPPEVRVVPVVNFQLLPDMGRMNG